MMEIFHLVRGNGYMGVYNCQNLLAECLRFVHFIVCYLNTESENNALSSQNIGDKTFIGLKW